MGQSAPAAASYLESAAAGALAVQTLAWFCTATWLVFTPPLTLAATLRFRKNRCHWSERLENHRSPQSWPVVRENQLGLM